MSLDTLFGVVLGAALALLGGFATELWNERRTRRAGARLLLNEMHLNLAAAYKLRMQAEHPLGAEIEPVLRQAEIGDLRDTAWQAVSDKLPVIGTLDDFREIQQAYAGIALVRERATSVGMLDALARTIGSATIRVARLAGASRAETRDVEELLESMPLPTASAD